MTSPELSENEVLEFPERVLVLPKINIDEQEADKLARLAARADVCYQIEV
ncbi:MAG: hypothetical protein NZM26_01755 [Patescibacteria group bacterium]|nr:hypothetical protein [Patescibacteria group bacterium]